MKRTFLLLSAALLAVLLLADCAGKREEKKVVFAFVPKLLDNPVFNVAWQGAQAAAAELGNGTIDPDRCWSRRAPRRPLRR